MTLLGLYCCYSQLRNTPGKFMISICISLLWSQVLFLLSGVRWNNLDSIFCITMAAVQHFTWLFMFFQSTSFAVWIAHNITAVTYNRSSLKLALCFSTFIALILIGVSLLVSKYLDISYIQNDVCWLSASTFLPYFFLMPVGICILANIAAFLAVIVKMRRNTMPSNQTVNQPLRVFPAILRLSLLMGFTWISGFLANIPGLTSLWYPFILFNSFQGVHLLIGFGLNHDMRARIRNSLSQMMQKSRTQ